MTKGKRIEFRCTICFNAVKKYVLIDEGTYSKVQLMCQGHSNFHTPAPMCEVVNLSEGVPNA